MAESVKDFLDGAYQLISSSSPTQPLYGNDFIVGLRILNRLLSAYSSSSLLLTISTQVSTSIIAGTTEVTFANATYTPTPTFNIGRLSNLENAWIELDGVTYPLIDESRNVFFDAYKYDPLAGLPQYVIVQNNLNQTTVRIYPQPSQTFEIFFFGKFELAALQSGSDLSQLPDYYSRFFHLAVARDLCVYKGRASAWTPFLEQLYQEAKDDMESVSSVNLDIENDQEVLLNGAWRVRAGI
jgi:hypothetical protein